MSWAALLVLLASALTGGSVADEISRLEGHTIEITGASYEIRDIAGEGAPVVGVVERDGPGLYINSRAGRFELLGPLAIPRIAGPGYKVWVLGEITGDAIKVRRLGVLRSPHR